MALSESLAPAAGMASLPLVCCFVHPSPLFPQFCVRVCSGCLILAMVGHYVPGIMISSIICEYKWLLGDFPESFDKLLEVCSQVFHIPQPIPDKVTCVTPHLPATSARSLGYCLCRPYTVMQYSTKPAEGAKVNQ